MKLKNKIRNYICLYMSFIYAFSFIVNANPVTLSNNRLGETSTGDVVTSDATVDIEDDILSGSSVDIQSNISTLSNTSSNNINLTSDTEPTEYGDLTITSSSSTTLSENSVCDSLTITGGTLNLNGYELIVNGNITQTGGGITIGGGRLLVDGNYTAGTTSTCKGCCLTMINENDYVLINGDIFFNGHNNHTNYLTEGTLVLKGNFTQKSTNSGCSRNNFNCTGNHTVILCGDSNQTIYFEDYDSSKFNNLYITKELSNYTFTPESIADTAVPYEMGTDEVPQSPIGLEIADITGNDIKLSWRASVSDNILRYNVYRNNEFLASTASTSYTDTVDNLASEYVYSVTAVSNFGKESQHSSIVTKEAGAGAIFNYNGSTYQVYDKSLSWTEAKTYCEQLGGHLVTITDADEQAFIANTVLESTGKDYYWLGGTDEETEGVWKWITNEAWSYTNWDSPQPDNAYDEDYLHLYASNKTWNDLNVDASRYFGLSNFGFICEWEGFVINSIVPIAGSNLSANTEFSVNIGAASSSLNCTLYYKGENASSWVEIGSNEVTSVNQSNVKIQWNAADVPNGTYDIKVCVSDERGTELTKIYSSYFLQSTAPEAAVLTATAGNLSASLSWTNADSNISYYKVYRSRTDEDYRYLGKVETTSYTDPDLSSEITYNYYVVSVNQYGNSSTSNIVTVTPNFVDTVAPVANAGFDMAGIINESFSFIGSNSTDNVGIVSYLWSFGDGTTSTEANPIHTYTSLKDETNEDYDYTATLTVTDAAGNSSMSSITVTVYPDTQIGTLNLTVKGSDGRKLSNAYVFIDLPGTGQKIYMTNSSGIATLKVMAGNYNISAYYQGYVPNEDNFAVTQYVTTAATLTLNKSELVTQEVVVMPMTKDEIIEAGIDISDPDNQYVYTITTTLVFEQKEITLPPVVTSGTGKVYSGGSVYYCSGGSAYYGGGSSTPSTEPSSGTSQTIIVPQVIANEEHPEVPPTLAYLVIPSTVSWLKEFFNVQMVLINQAPEAFVIQDSVVTLSLPEGLSLANTSTPQTLTVDLGDIAGQSTGSAEWIIRGDVSGTYDLCADFSGVLMPFEADVAANFQTEEAITVYGEKALKMYIYPEDTAYIGHQYYAMFQMMNQSNTTIYDFEWKFGSGDGTKYVLDDITDQLRLPFLHDGDSIYVEELPPYTYIGGIYETTFAAEGDPERNYYSLLETLISSPNEDISVIDTEVVPIQNNAVYGTYNGTTIDQAVLGQIAGQAGIALKEYYNSSLEDYLTVWGRNRNFMFGYTLTQDSYGRYVLTYPDGSKYYFMPKYVVNSGELTDEEVTVNINTMILDGYTPISRGSKNYTLTETDNGFVVETGNHYKYYFDSNGTMTRCEDKTGYAINITTTATTITVEEETTGKTIVASIGADGFVDTVLSDAGTYSMNYDEDGNLTSITDPMSDKTNFEYTSGKLSKREAENAENIKTTIFEDTYDDKGRLIRRTDGKGNSITYSYDTTSEYWRIIVSKTNRLGYNSTEVYNRFGELVKTVDELGNGTTYTYDGNGNRTSVTDPNDNAVLYIYDDYDNLVEYIDAEGTKTEYSYDSKSNLLKTLNIDGTFVTNTYDAQNRLLTSADERGTVTEYTYDDNGNITEMKITSDDDTIAASYAYTNSQLTTFTDFNGNVTTYNYDSSYTRIISTVDALNNTVLYEYDGKNRLTKITYPDNAYEQFTYDNFGNITSSRDRNGNVTTYVYDENNNLISSTIAGNTTSYTYDKEEQLTALTDCSDKTKHISYDAAGRIIEETDFEGNKTGYAYDKAGRLISITTGEATTHYGYYKTGKLYTVTDPYNNTTSYYYDIVWNVNKVEDALGNNAIYNYDNSGNLTKVTTPFGVTNEFTYDFRGNVITEKDGNGNVTTYSYDNNGNLLSETDAQNNTITHTYDALNRQISITNANGYSTEYVYDSVGNVLSVLNPLGVKQSMTYDGNGNVLTVKDSNDVIIQRSTYDYNNNPLEVTDALNNVVRYTYDGNGNVKTYTTARNNIYTYDYDGNGNLVKVTDPLDGVIENTFDGRGNQTALKDENNNTTTYSYDLLNRLLSETTADGSSDSYVYDALSQLTEYTNKRGQATAYTYNVDGDIVSKTTVEGSTAYTYDGNGNILTVTDENGTISRTYDSLNRITSYTDANNNTILYEYDSVGNLTKLTYPDNKIVRYSYNANNQLAKVQDWANRITIYTYDNNGRLSSETRPDGTIQTYTYNANGQLTQTVDKTAEGSIINEYSYEYDADGNVITENSANEPNVNSITIPNEDMVYGDANQLATFNGVVISYDADGNMLSTPLGDKWGVLTYDSQNMLTDVATSDGAIAVYGYDAEGNRTLKTENGITTTYVVDPNAALSQVLMSTKNGETTYYIYGLGLIAQENSQGYKTYHYDYRGSTTAITDINGNVIDTVFYDPYGSILTRTGTTDTPFLYVGQYGVETDNSGLYYMRARYYNPLIQRFINVDPIRNGYNWYSYTSGNAISYIDPTGYLDWSTQADDLWWGMYAKMEDFQNRTVSGIGDFIMDPKDHLIELKDNVVQGVSSTAAGIMNGDITLGSIAKGALDSGVQTAKSIGKGVYKLLPSTEISDAEAYMLGYNIEGAALDTSVGIVSAYASGKVTGIIKKAIVPKVKTLAKLASPKLKTLGSKVVDGLKDNRGFITNPFSNNDKRNFKKWLNAGEKNYKVYFGVIDNEYEYTGITRQKIGVRLSQHRRKGKMFDRLEIQYSNLTKNQARAIEQYYIENGPNQINIINSISKKSQYYKPAIKWASEYIKKNGV